MFIDSVEVEISSGDGGAGAISFRKEKFVPKGGPDGGNGGAGGDVYIKVDRNTHTLNHFRGVRKYKASNGSPGSAFNRDGKQGEDIILIVPPGSVVYDNEDIELFDLKEEGEIVKVLSGGKGGLGNTHFKSSTNQVPRFAQQGMSGDSLQVKIELKLIADVGLLGYPNVGKSTLISTLSNARPEVADYEFTTLKPSLGIVENSMFESFVMADIPGIIEGASSGKGLGIDFLKHIERTEVLLYLIDAINYRDIILQVENLKEEISKYSDKLSRKPYAIVLSKTDAITQEESDEKLKIIADMFDVELKQNGSYGIERESLSYYQDEYLFDKNKLLFLLSISSSTHRNTESLKHLLNYYIKKIRGEDIV